MTATLNASTSAGVILTSDTSGSLAIQSNGTTIATASSTGLAISTYNPAASLITSGTAVASTSGTSIDFTGIPSWVKRITVMFNAVSTNGTSNIQVQIGAGSVDSTGYFAQCFYINSSPSYATSTTGNIITAAISAAGTISGTAVLNLISSNTWVLTSNLGRSDILLELGNGIKTLSGTLDRVRITTVNGTDTFDAGSINIFYE